MNVLLHELKSFQKASKIMAFTTVEAAQFGHGLYGGLFCRIMVVHMK